MSILVNVNGKLVSEEKAAVSINNRSFRYGDGCFETICISEGTIALWPYHWQRLWHTIQVLLFQPPAFFTSQYLEAQILQLAVRNNHQKLGRIRLTIYRGNGGVYDPENHFPNYSIQSWPLNNSVAQLNSNGLVCGLYQQGIKAADGFSNLKSNNFLLYTMAALFAKQMHWNDAFVNNHKRSIADATIANIFIIKNGEIITPPLSDGPIAGTMRRYLLTYGKGQGFNIQEKSLTEADILNADECFLTNAVYGIMWVKSFGSSEYGNNLVVSLYDQLIRPLRYNSVQVKD